MVEKENHDCATTGHCAVHGVEIERRKAVTEEIRRVENEITSMHEQLISLWKHVATNESFRAQVKITVLIMGGIWIGSFVYTYNHKQDASQEYNKFHRLTNANQSSIARIEGKLLVVEDRYARLIRDNQQLMVDMRALNENVLAFLRVLDGDKDRIQKVQIENYKDRNTKGTYKVPNPDF